MERIIKGQLIKVPAWLGCEGCIYENEGRCPADSTTEKLQFNIGACQEADVSLIFKYADEDL